MFGRQDWSTGGINYHSHSLTFEGETGVAQQMDTSQEQETTTTTASNTTPNPVGNRNCPREHEHDQEDQEIGRRSRGARDKQHKRKKSKRNRSHSGSSQEKEKKEPESKKKRGTGSGGRGRHLNLGLGPTGPDSGGGDSSISGRGRSYPPEGDHISNDGGRPSTTKVNVERKTNSELSGEPTGQSTKSKVGVLEEKLETDDLSLDDLMDQKEADVLSRNDVDQYLNGLLASNNEVI